MKNRISLISIIATLALIGCSKNSISGEWTLKDSTTECHPLDLITMTKDICITFNSLDLYITEDEINNIHEEPEIQDAYGEILFNYSYQGLDENTPFETESDIYNIKIMNWGTTDEPIDYRIKIIEEQLGPHDFQSSEEIKYEETGQFKTKINYSLSEKSKLNCEFEIEYARWNRKTDYKIQTTFERVKTNFLTKDN